MKVWDIIDEHLMKGDPLQLNRLPTFYPSSASCKNDEDASEVIGACLRANYYRCAGYDKSNEPSLWSQYVFAGGNLWEKWITEQLKQAGVYLGSNLKFADLDRYISGEVDIVVEDPVTNETVIVEVKTFYGYNAKKKICGNTKVKPSPKEPHILQAFLYLDQFKDQVNKVVLLYFARDDHSRQQFVLTREKIGDKTYPKIETIHRGQSYSYVDKRITMEGIYERYDELMEHLKGAKLPKPDFEHEFSDQKIKQLHELGEISKTAYENWEKGLETPGYFMCKNYCDYRDMCRAQKEEDGDR